MEQVVTDESFQDLGELEQAVMQLIWVGRPMTAQAVATVAPAVEGIDGANRPATAGRKGYVIHTVDRRTYVFQATAPRGRVAAKAVRCQCRC
jgi:hypothetical protein